MMKIENQALYDLYKPLRNHLKPVAIENAFYVIWAYINYFQFNQTFPQDIQVHPSITDEHNYPNRGVYEWELSLLAREMLVNGQEGLSFGTKNFNNLDYFAGAINKLKDFENNAYPIFGGVHNVQKEMRRIAHRQFPWQTKPSAARFVRYFKIYNNPKVSTIVEDVIGLSIQRWYIIGTAFIGAILKHPKVNVDPEITIIGIFEKEFNIFLSFISADIKKIRQVIEKEVSFNDQYVYTFNPLEYYPLVKIGNYYYCPVITFLVWRITSGIYFDLIDNKNFGHPFGLAFQDYLGEVSEKVLNVEKIKIFPEEKYKIGNNEKDSVDFILSQSNAAFFVEAKAKRMQARSKSQLISDEAMEKDLEVLADDIVQVYLTIRDYKNGQYPHFLYQQDVKIYPLVVTLEDWFLIGKDAKNLKEKVKLKLEEKKVVTEFIDEMPFTVCSAQDYENLVQVLNKYKIEEIMGSWFLPEKDGYDFGQFLINNYRECCERIDNYFPGDFKKIYPKQIMQEMKE